MASTYENDLRLEEMATGENSGSWGTKTNTNLELVADAFSYGTEIIADADTAITIADGAADAARSLALKINSSEDLTTTRVVTLGPNTTSKVWIIENNTSGGQTLTISAGSGSNVTLPNGVTKIIATDGIGAAANVTELYTNLHNITVDGVLSLADGTNSAPSLTNTGDTNTGLYFPAADEVGITVGGTQVFKADSTGADVTGVITTDGMTTSAVIKAPDGSAAAPAYTNSGDTDGGMYFPAANQVALAAGGAERLLVNSTGIDVTGEITADGLTVDGASVLNDNLTVKDSGSPTITLTSYPGTQDTVATIFSGRADFSGTDSFLRFGTNDGTSTKTRLDISSLGDITFYDTSGNASFVYDESAGSTFNEQGADRDFRVESDSNAYALYMDAGASKVSINTASSSNGILNVYSPTTYGKIFMSDSTLGYGYGAFIQGYGVSGSGGYFQLGSVDANTQTVAMQVNQQATSINFLTRDGASGTSASRLILDQIGGSGAVFNETGQNYDFRVESDNNANMLFVDAGTNTVQIGTNALATSGVFPSPALYVKGATTAHFGIAHFEAQADESVMGIGHTAGGSFQFRNSYRSTGAFADIEFLDISNNSVFRVGMASTTAESVFNEGGNNKDFRVESDSNANMLFVDAGNDRVVIGGTTQAGKLTVQGGTTTENTMFVYGEATGKGGRIVSIRDTRATVGTDGSAGLHFTSSPGTDYVLAKYYDGAVSNFMLTDQLGNEYISVESASNIVINQGGSSGRDFRVESDSNTHALFVDAGHGAAVGVGSSNPSSAVSGDAIIGISGYGIILQQEEASVASGSSVDLTVNSGGGGYQGMLIISNTVTTNAAVRTHAMYFVAGRGTDGVFNLISSDDGATGGAGYSLTFANNGLIRMTNNSGNTTNIVMSFFGSKSL